MCAFRFFENFGNQWIDGCTTNSNATSIIYKDNCKDVKKVITFFYKIKHSYRVYKIGLLGLNESKMKSKRTNHSRLCIFSYIVCKSSPTVMHSFYIPPAPSEAERPVHSRTGVWRKPSVVHVTDRIYKQHGIKDFDWCNPRLNVTAYVDWHNMLHMIYVSVLLMLLTKRLTS